MFLSRIIELALVRGYYGTEPSEDIFMCNALHSMMRAGLITRNQHDKAVKCIQAMMLGIFPDYQCYTLVDALYRKGVTTNKDIFDNYEFTQQLYVWWVFDLKRKGL